MQYQITSDNLDVTESMKTLAMQKFEKIEGRLTQKELDEAMVRIVMNKSGAEGEFRVKAELSFEGKKYFGTETAFKLETALIKAIEEVERMRRKDDIAFQEEWAEKREFKHELGEKMLEEDIEETEKVE